MLRADMRRRTSEILGALRPFARQAPRMHPSLVRAPARPHLQLHLDWALRSHIFSSREFHPGEFCRAHSQGGDSDFYRSDHRKQRVFSGVNVHREADGPGLALARSFSLSSLRSPRASSRRPSLPHSPPSPASLPSRPLLLASFLFRPLLLTSLPSLPSFPLAPLPLPS
jgi:hypothetical protein